ncbi:MAG: hypothetical protein ABIH24_09275 [Verrucomicrobiota bacterium]
MKQLMAALSVLAFLAAISCADAGNKTNEVVMWGKQIAGSGHAKNAKIDGNTLVLTAVATITSVEADAEGYSIWSVVTPENRTAAVVMSGGKGKPDIVGKTLAQGSYRVIPGLYGKSATHVTIKLKLK